MRQLKKTAATRRRNKRSPGTISWGNGENKGVGAKWEETAGAHRQLRHGGVSRL